MKDELANRLLRLVYELTREEGQRFALGDIARQFPESTWQEVLGAGDSLMAKNLLRLYPVRIGTEAAITRAGIEHVEGQGSVQ